MKQSASNYHAYLLRLWRTDTGQDQLGDWRASVENTRTGERLGFADLERLFVFLMEQTQRATRAADDAEARVTTNEGHRLVLSVTVVARAPDNIQVEITAPYR